MIDVEVDISLISSRLNVVQGSFAAIRREIDYIDDWLQSGVNWLQNDEPAFNNLQQSICWVSFAGKKPTLMEQFVCTSLSLFQFVYNQHARATLPLKHEWSSHVCTVIVGFLVPHSVTYVKCCSTRFSKCGIMDRNWTVAEHKQYPSHIQWRQHCPHPSCSETPLNIHPADLLAHSHGTATK